MTDGAPAGGGVTGVTSLLPPHAARESSRKAAPVLVRFDLEFKVAPG
jgi:hypothetical protein